MWPYFVRYLNAELAVRVCKRIDPIFLLGTRSSPSRKGADIMPVAAGVKRGEAE
jgi:hypothetical protein